MFYKIPRALLELNNYDKCNLNIYKSSFVQVSFPMAVVTEKRTHKVQYMISLTSMSFYVRNPGIINLAYWK